MIQDWMIINKIKMGDPDAWDILVHKYYDSVYCDTTVLSRFKGKRYCDNYWHGGIYCTVTYLSRP